MALAVICLCSYRLFVNTGIRLHLVHAHLYDFNGFEVTEGYQIPIHVV